MQFEVEYSVKFSSVPVLVDIYLDHLELNNILGKSGLSDSSSVVIKEVTIRVIPAISSLRNSIPKNILPLLHPSSRV